MEINNLQGAASYTNTPNTTPPVDGTSLRDQNLEASQADLTTESTAAAQRAFEVDISREAQDRLAAQNTEKAVQAQPPTPENQTGQNIAQTHEQSQIVNIVA